MSLPVISINEADREKIDISRDIGKSCERYGFFIIKDHNLKISIIENVRNLSKEFFSLSLESKMKYHQVGGAGQRGYTPFGIEKAVNASSPDQKEFWHHGRSNWKKEYINTIPKNESVSEIENFDQTLNDLFKDLDFLGKRILTYISLYLNLSSDWFDKKINQGNSILRLIHYPPTDKKNNGLRAGPHEDINLITLLLGTQQEGLEILDQNNNWIPIKTSPNIIVCNVGDMLQRLTNKKLICQGDHMILQITREEIQAATTRYLERGGQIQQIDKVVGEPIFGDDLILTEDVLEMIEVQESDLW